MAEERVRAAVLEEPNVRALLEEFPDATLETIRPRKKPDHAQPRRNHENGAKPRRPQLAEAQENLDKIEVEGASGGGLVKIRATAKGRILGVSHRRQPAGPGRKVDARGPDRRRAQRRPRQGRCRRRRADAEDDHRPASSRRDSSCPSKAGFANLGRSRAVSEALVCSTFRGQSGSWHRGESALRTWGDAGLAAARDAAGRPCRARAWRWRNRHGLGRRLDHPHQLAQRRPGRAAHGAGARSARHEARRPRRHAGDEP